MNIEGFVTCIKPGSTETYLETCKYLSFHRCPTFNSPNTDVHPPIHQNKACIATSTVSAIPLSSIHVAKEGAKYLRKSATTINMSTPSTNTPSLSTPVNTPPEPTTSYSPGPSLRKISQHGPHASIVLLESDVLAGCLDKQQPVYVDTDHLGIAHIAAVSR